MSILIVHENLDIHMFIIVSAQKGNTYKYVVEDITSTQC